MQSSYFTRSGLTISLASLLVAATFASGCSSDADNGAPPDAASDSPVSTHPDASNTHDSGHVQEAGSGIDDAATDSPAPADTGTDTGTTDAGAQDASEDAADAAETHDASVQDASSHDASVQDASSHDASVQDASSHDASVHDATVSTPPMWTQGPTVSAVYADTTASAQELNVSWSPATDTNSPAENVRYLLCWGTTATACAGTGFATAMTTAYGATNATIPNLTPNTTYYVWVRAENSSLLTETGDHSASAQTAVSYAANIDTQIFTARSTSGGCHGCHAWSYTATVNVAFTSTAGCTMPAGTYLVEPGNPSNSLIYLKMTGHQGSTCGGQMPPGSANHISSLESMMGDWITQGAHNN